MKDINFYHSKYNTWKRRNLKQQTLIMRNEWMFE